MFRTRVSLVSGCKSLVQANPSTSCRNIRFRKAHQNALALTIEIQCTPEADKGRHLPNKLIDFHYTYDTSRLLFFALLISIIVEK